MKIIVEKVGKSLGYGACYKSEAAYGNIGRGATKEEALADFKARFQAIEDQRLAAEREARSDLRELTKKQINTAMKHIKANIDSLSKASLRVDARAIGATWRDELRALRLELAMRKVA